MGKPSDCPRDTRLAGDGRPSKELKTLLSPSSSIEELEGNFSEINIQQCDVCLDDVASGFTVEDLMDGYIGDMSRSQEPRYESQPKSRSKLRKRRQPKRVLSQSSKSDTTTSASDSEIIDNIHINKITGDVILAGSASTWSHKPQFLFHKMPPWEIFNISLDEASVQWTTGPVDAIAS